MLDTQVSLYKIDFASEQLFITDDVWSEVSETNRPPTQLIMAEKNRIQSKPTLKDSMLVFTLLEVIEHIPKAMHATLIKNILSLQPDILIVTTPNIEFNKFFNMQPGQLRDADHKFEFNSAEF